MFGFGTKGVDGVTAKLAKMVEDLHEVAEQQAKAKAEAEARVEAAKGDAAVAWQEGVRATSIANKIQQLLS